MGTVVRQKVYGIVGQHCAELAAQEIARLEAIWTVFSPDSEICGLAANAGQQAAEVAPDTVEILLRAIELHALTRGALDITAGSLVHLWRLAAERSMLPTRAELAAARALVDITGIEVNELRRVRLRLRGQQLNLGAIGKGYAADRCIDLYRSRGARHAMIDLGGNVAVLGVKPDGSAWRVGVQDPSGKRGQYVGHVDVADCSVVTSGSYERVFELGGRRYSHIIDPRSGLPVDNDILSVTVVHASSLLADALATACMVLGSQAGLSLANDLVADVMLICTHGRLFTPGMARLFRPRTCPVAG
ncbi:MAG: thiamine biosynthesis lipoprotein ApbE [Pseudomonadota bacterium]